MRSMVDVSRRVDGVRTNPADAQAHRWRQRLGPAGRFLRSIYPSGTGERGRNAGLYQRRLGPRIAGNLAATAGQRAGQAVREYFSRSAGSRTNGHDRKKTFARDAAAPRPPARWKSLRFTRDA